MAGIPWLKRVVAAASSVVEAGFNLSVGPLPTTLADGDLINTSTGAFIRTAGVTRGIALGSFTDNFVLATGQTTTTLTYQAASLADIQPSYGVLNLDPSQITSYNAATGVVTFNAVPASMNGKTLSLAYTRIT